MEAPVRQPLLIIDDLCKSFGSTKALNHVSLSIEPGEVHALIGENGAGKSTLIKILGGMYSPDTGTIRCEETTVPHLTLEAGRSLGISILHQERNLVPNFTVAENLFLGLPAPTRGIIALDFKEMELQARRKLEALGIEIDVTARVSKLTPPQQTLLELAHTMMRPYRLLVMDEPTASLTDKETDLLFNIIDRCRQDGASVLYVSHRLEEVLSISDRISVLKNGMNVGTFKTEETTKSALIACMTDHWTGPTGRRSAKSRASGTERVTLEARSIRSADRKVKDVSFCLHEGEILGVFGLGGSGRTSLLETLYGYRALSAGSILADGRAYQHSSCARSLRKGIVLICEDRKRKGIFPNMSVMANTILSTLARYRKGIMMDERHAEADTYVQMEMLRIKTAGPHQRLWQLSGGNQQKVVFAKALMSDPHIWLCDEPTMAIDVGTRSDIHALLRKRADEGDSILFVSSDLLEILEISDRILIMTNGTGNRTLINDGLDARQVLGYCYEPENGKDNDEI